MLTMLIMPAGHPEFAALVTINGGSHGMTGVAQDLALAKRRTGLELEECSPDLYVDLMDKALRSMGWSDSERQGLLVGTRQALGL